MALERLDELERTIAELPLEAALLGLSSRPDVEQTVRDLLEIAARQAQSDPGLARRALDIGDRLAPGVGCDDALPASLYLRARLTLNSGLPDAALDLIARARSQWLAIDRPLDAYRTDLGRMHVLDDLGRHREAVTVSDVLLNDLARMDDDDLSHDETEQLEWIRAAANENLGVACGFTGQHERALAAYRVAEEGYDKIGGADDMARCRANRGVELVAIGRAVDGLEVLASAATIFSDLDDRLSYAQCLGHMADAQLLLGRYTSALGGYEEARVLLDRLGARSEGCRIRLRTVRAYLALNLIDEAEALAGQTEKVLIELGLGHDLAEARWLCAVAQLRAGRAREALPRLESAADGATESDDPPLLIRILLARSDAMAALGDRDGALQAAARALALVEGGHWPTEELHVLVRTAQLVDEQDAVDGHLQRAVKLADQLGLPHLRYPVLLELGRHRRRRGDEPGARRCFQSAIDAVEGLRGLIPDESVRTSFLEGRTAAHVELMSMMIATGRPDQWLAAFDLAEASKARTLADILAGVVQPNSTSIDRSSTPDLGRHEADLHAAYSALSSADVAMNRERRRAVHDRVVELERTIRLAALQAEATGNATADRQGSGRAPVRPLSSEQVVEYHAIGDRLVAFVWSGGELEVVATAASVDEVAELVARWNRSRRRFEMAGQIDSMGGDRLISNADEVLRKLWVAVFAPLAAHLSAKDENLVVIPHGPLHAVPFHALIGPDGPEGRHRTITLAPSYAVAARLRSTEPTEGHGRSLVVGVPDRAAPAVAGEARFVAGVLPGAQLLLGENATIDAVIEALGQPRDVLHLACHGLHRPPNPMFSGLKLADGWLTAKEVIGLRLHGTLVVLSACETGRQGGPGAGDEAVGLARSFLAAGASAVVVSLWLTGDHVTAELMQAFYRALRSGAEPAAALRTAQTSVAENHPHPAAWAPFVIHGGGQGDS